MINTSYPIENSASKLEIVIGHPELDPKSQHGDRRCNCVLQCDEYKKEFYAHGIDDIQCVWLCLKMLREEIKSFQKTTGNVCEYTFFLEEDFLKGVHHE